MLKEKTLDWGGRFPYDALAGVGITPKSTMKEVKDASFDLMAAGQMTPEIRQAWDQLRTPAGRLLVDFFLYSTDWPDELAQCRRYMEERLRSHGFASTACPVNPPRGFNAMREYFCALEIPRLEPRPPVELPPEPDLPVFDPPPFDK